MQVHVDSGDIGYEVWLDGNKLDNCFAADDKLGYVWIRPKDSAGKTIIDESGEFITRKKLTGNVTIKKMK